VKLEYGCPSAELTSRVRSSPPARPAAGRATRRASTPTEGRLGSTYRTIYTIGGTGVRAVDDAATVATSTAPRSPGATAAFVARPTARTRRSRSTPPHRSTPPSTPRPACSPSARGHARPSTSRCCAR
jgi:hypothetical protein